MKLIEKYLYRGNNLYVDNWYSSRALFEILHQKKTGACGAEKMNYCDLINFQVFKLRQNEQISFHTDILLAVKWKNKRDVHILPTIYGTKMIITEKTDYQTSRRVVKLTSVKDNNENKWLIDISDNANVVCRASALIIQVVQKSSFICLISRSSMSTYYTCCKLVKNLLFPTFD